MSQSLARVFLHIIFSTKDRRPMLRDLGFREQMFRMLSNQITQTGCVSLSVGGYIDHVHLAVALSRQITIAKLIESVKAKTSQWASKRACGTKVFSWQKGYGVFSVSQSKLSEVDRYIREQEMHHQRLSFRDEFRAICQRHEIEIDERFVWD